MEFPAHRSDELGEAPLDRHVDVLVVVGEAEAAGFELGRDLVESAKQLRLLVGREHTLLGENAHVGPRLPDVVRCEPSIEADRRVQPLEDRVGRLPKPGHSRSLRAS